MRKDSIRRFITKHYGSNISDIESNRKRIRDIEQICNSYIYSKYWRPTLLSSNVDIDKEERDLTAHFVEQFISEFNNSFPIKYCLECKSPIDHYAGGCTNYSGNCKRIIPIGG